MSDDELMAEGHRDVIQAIELLEEALPRIEQPLGIYIALFDLYTDLEDMSQAGACLLEAGRRVSLGHQAELTYFLYNHLELFAQLDPSAQEIYERLAHTISRDEGDLGQNTVHLEQRKIYKYDLIPELLLAQHLKRARQISDAEYHIVIHDLCYYSNTAIESPTTLLYVLRHRELPHESDVVSFLAQDSGVPYIDLTLIEPTHDVLSLLHLEFITVRGACAFGAIADEPLIAVLDPYNLQLRDDVATLLQRPCHFYLCSAKGYEQILNLSRSTNLGAE